MKKTAFYLILVLSFSYVTSCASRIQHADPFYNVHDNDFSLLHLPLINPVEATREAGRTPWQLDLRYGPWVSIPNSQEVYGYWIYELDKFAVSDGVIMAYSAYVDKEANPYIQDNYYHWFIGIPDKEIAEGFQTEAGFRQYIQTLGIQDPNWQTPDEAYEQFKKTGCLEWIPDCN